MLREEADAGFLGGAVVDDDERIASSTIPS
jgi:hypothetical protein